METYRRGKEVPAGREMIKKPPRAKSYELDETGKIEFTNILEAIIRQRLSPIREVSPELTGRIERQITNNLVGFEAEKLDDRVEAVERLSKLVEDLPEEMRSLVEPLKEAVASQLVTHPDFKVRLVTLDLIVSLLDQTRKEELLLDIVTQDPDPVIVAGAFTGLASSQTGREKLLPIVASDPDLVIVAEVRRRALWLKRTLQEDDPLIKTLMIAGFIADL